MRLPHLAAGASRRTGVDRFRAGIRTSGDKVAAYCDYTCSGDPNNTSRCILGQGENQMAAETAAHNAANAECASLNYGTATHIAWVASCD